MRKVLAVVRREFVERVRTRWFWISALLGPIFFAALIFLPYLFSGGRAKRLVVVDGTQSSFGANVADSLNTSGAFTLLNRMAPRAGLLDSLTGEVSRRRLDGFLIVTDATVDSGVAEYRSSNVSSLRDIGVLKGSSTISRSPTPVRAAPTASSCTEKSEAPGEDASAPARVWLSPYPNHARS